MKNAFRKLWAWLRCEDGRMPKETGIPLSRAFKYSKLTLEHPTCGQIGDGDMVQISHRLAEGKYKTCYVTVKQLRKAMARLNARAGGKNGHRR